MISPRRGAQLSSLAQQSTVPYHRSIMPTTHLALTKENLKKLPKQTRLELLVEEAENEIERGKDASALLDRLKEEIEAPSSSARPATGQSALQAGRAARPVTASSAGAPPSIAGSLQERIQHSLLSGSHGSRPPSTASSQRSQRAPSMAASQQSQRTTRSQRSRPPTAAEVLAQNSDLANALEEKFRERLCTAERPMTGGSNAPSTGARKPPPSPQLLAPVFDPKDSVPDHMIEKFRAEYRAMQAERQAAERVPNAAPPASHHQAPLTELTNGRHQSVPTTEPRVLEPTAATIMMHTASSVPVKQRGGRRHVSARASMSTVGSILSGVSEE